MHDEVFLKPISFSKNDLKSQSEQHVTQRSHGAVQLELMTHDDAPESLLGKIIAIFSHK
jgi:hypothetical protein